MLASVSIRSSRIEWAVWSLRMSMSSPSLNNSKAYLAREGGCLKKGRKRSQGRVQKSVASFRCNADQSPHPFGASNNVPPFVACSEP